MAEIDDLRAQLECAKSDVAELRQENLSLHAQMEDLSAERILISKSDHAFAETQRQANPADIRESGWSVAVHNDYRLDGENQTFWLFTHPSGQWIKGEGRSDAEALNQCRATLSQIAGPLLADAEARIKELGRTWKNSSSNLLQDERGHIADMIAGLLNVYVRYEDSIDPDHETVEAINRGKAALEALRKDLGTDVPPSSTRAKC